MWSTIFGDLWLRIARLHKLFGHWSVRSMRRREDAYIKCNDVLPSCVSTGNLYCIFHCLGPAVGK